MELFFWILLGILAGGIISLIIGTRSLAGVLTDVVLGSIGAIVGGLMLTILTQPINTNINIYNVIIAALGAIVLIWLGKMISTSKEN